MANPEQEQRDLLLTRQATPRWLNNYLASLGLEGCTAEYPSKPIFERGFDITVVNLKRAFDEWPLKEYSGSFERFIEEEVGMCFSFERWEQVGIFTNFVIRRGVLNASVKLACGAA